MARISSNSRPPKGRPKKPAPRSSTPKVVEVVTELLGSRGDALASFGGENVYIADALAGERLSVQLGERRGEGREATLLSVITPSPERVTPPCPHFGVCGGCALQQAAPALIAVWKRSVVTEALAHRGLDPVPVADTLTIAPGTRRRATFGYRRISAGLIIGFNQRHSDQVVDLGGCLLLRRDIADLLPRFREIFTPLIPVGAAGDLFVTDSDNGPDVRLDFPEQPTLEVREGLVQAAQRLDLARLTLRIKGVDEPLIVNRPAVVSFAGIPVTLPVGGFLQPSAEGEAALLTLIEEGLNGADGPIIDLFAGLGTFSLPLSQHRKVTAWEGDLVAATALAAAAPARVQTHRRDLFREPLMTHDWQGISAIVLDPPRAGANSQAEVLARSPDAPGKLVYVSCNPATFARDARILVDGCYKLEKVTPLDQFPWSAHVELVAVFSRAATAPPKAVKYVSLTPGRRPKQPAKKAT